MSVYIPAHRQGKEREREGGGGREGEGGRGREGGGERELGNGEV